MTAAPRSAVSEASLGIVLAARFSRVTIRIPIRSIGLILLATLLPGGAQAQPTATPAGRELAQRFLLADRNSDGALSRQEVEQAGWLTEQRNRFDALDTDRSGTVTLVELSAAVASQVRQWLGADTDRDGRISAAEAAAHGDLGKTFGRIDDGDGFITTEELELFGARSYYQHGDLPSVAPNIFERRF